jgi:hypothetical protein
MTTGMASRTTRMSGACRGEAAATVGWGRSTVYACAGRYVTFNRVAIPAPRPTQSERNEFSTIVVIFSQYSVNVSKCTQETLWDRRYLFAGN